MCKSIKEMICIILCVCVCVCGGGGGGGDGCGGGGSLGNMLVHRMTIFFLYDDLNFCYNISVSQEKCFKLKKKKNIQKRIKDKWTVLSYQAL